MKNLIYCFVLLFLGTSCVKDDTTSAFIQLNTVTIEGLDEVYTVQLGDSLFINPQITTSHNDESKIDFVWYKYTVSSTADTISYEKNLRARIGDVEPGELNYLVLKAIDTSTGVFYQQVCSLYTASTYSNGLIILCETDGERDLSFIVDNTDEVMNEIFSAANGGEKPNDAGRVFYIDHGARNPGAGRAVVVAANSETGGYYMDPTTLTAKYPLSGAFSFSPISDSNPTLNVQGFANGQGNDFLFSNGMMYDRDIPNYSPYYAYWDVPVLCALDPSETSISTTVFQPAGYPFYHAPIVYDNCNNRFLRHSSGGKAYTRISGNGDVLTAFDYNDLGDGVELVIGGYYTSDPNSCWALMNSTNDDTYFIITFTFVCNSDWTYTFNALTKTTVTEDVANRLRSATTIKSGNSIIVDTMTPWSYEVTGKYGTFMYVYNNDIYSYNVLTNTDGLLLASSADNYTVDNFLISPVTDSDEASFTRLALAVRDNSATGRKGKLVYYELNDLGGLSASKYFESEGFCDQIIDFDEKGE